MRSMIAITLLLGSALLVEVGDLQGSERLGVVEELLRHLRGPGRAPSGGPSPSWWSKTNRHCAPSWTNS